MEKRRKMSWILLAKIFGICLAVYVLTALVFLALVRLKKDSEGDLTLDSNSWHFKMAYPTRKFRSWFIDALKRRGINLCPYSSRLVFMFYLGWPGIILTKFVIFVISVFFFAPFGWWVSFDLESWGYDRDFRSNRFNLPEIKSFRIFPAYLYVILAYAWFMYRNPLMTLSGTVGILVGTLAGTVILKIAFKACRGIKNSESVSLFVSWAVDKKKGLCRHLKVV